MRPQLILMSHGLMAQEAYHSSAMIVGESSGVSIISLTEGGGIAAASKELSAVLSQIPLEKEVLIIADLYGGSPFNIALVEAQKRENTVLISGLNLGMLVEYAMKDAENLEEFAAHMLKAGLEGVKRAQIMQDDDDVDVDE